MNLQLTLWRADTCDCIFEFTFDYDLPLASQSPVATASKLCSQHSGLKSMSHQTRWNHVNGQNRRKNEAISDLADVLGLLNDPDIFTKLRELYLERFYLSGIDEDRIIHIVTKNLSQTRINSVQTRVDNKFGSGKVVIE